MISCRFCGQLKEAADPTCLLNIDREQPFHEWVNEAGELVNVCQYCHKVSLDVCERPDSYANDVDNDPDAMHVACDACDQNRRDDI